MPCWRLVLRKVATLAELESTWCFDDVLRCNELIDAVDELEQRP
jgi:hypothetical protein